MYKDKDKQREANRQASKKYRDSMTDKGMTVSPKVIPKTDIRVIPKRGKDIKCITIDDQAKSMKTMAILHSAQPYQMTVMERLFYRPASQLGRGETNFVSLPGRACYNMFKRKARG